MLIPDSPIACTRSSTRRVDTPVIQASWITAISAPLRALARFAKRRKVAALAQFRDAQLQGGEPVEGAVALTVAPGGAVALTVAPGGALAAALIAPGADRPFDVGFHQRALDILGVAVLTLPQRTYRRVIQRVRTSQ